MDISGLGSNGEIFRTLPPRRAVYGIHNISGDALRQLTNTEVSSNILEYPRKVLSHAPISYLAQAAAEHKTEPLMMTFCVHLCVHQYLAGGRGNHNLAAFRIRLFSLPAGNQ